MSRSEWQQKQCRPCEGLGEPLSEQQARKALLELDAGWELEQRRNGQWRIKKPFRFTGFREAIAFVNAVADLAESQDHHPEIFINYNNVRLTLSTHAIGGLSENDFILAAKIEEKNG